MQLSKILVRGQVAVPRKIRQEAGLRPGDVLAFEVVGPGHVENPREFWGQGIEVPDPLPTIT